MVHGTVVSSAGHYYYDCDGIGYLPARYGSVQRRTYHGIRRHSTSHAGDSTYDAGDSTGVPYSECFYQTTTRCTTTPTDTGHQLRHQHTDAQTYYNIQLATVPTTTNLRIDLVRRWDHGGTDASRRRSQPYEGPILGPGRQRLLPSFHARGTRLAQRYLRPTHPSTTSCSTTTGLGRPSARDRNVSTTASYQLRGTDPGG